MQFFRDDQGIIWPTGKINYIMPGKKVVPGQPGSYRAPRVYLEGNDNGVDVDDHVADELLARSGGIIPVDGRCHVVSVYLEEGQEPYVSADRVLGWKVDFEGMTHPIVLDCEFDGLTGRKAVEFEDGTVADNWGQTWASRDEWVAHMTEAGEAHREARARAQESLAKQESEG